MKIERRSDHIKILESESALLSRNNAYQCQNCKERYQLITKKEDSNNLFCMNCGHTTPIRTIKHGRSLVAPSIQQQTAIVTSEKITRSKDRKPLGINRKNSILEQELESKGFQIIQSDTIEPETR